MAKKAAAESKPAVATPTAEEKFVDLMLVAADFVNSCGGLEPAKKALLATPRERSTCLKA
jgi:hypothetical protein